MQVAVPRSRTPLRVQNLRVNNVEIPNSKRIEISLQYIYGIGSTTAKQILVNTVSNLLLLGAGRVVWWAGLVGLVDCCCSAAGLRSRAAGCCSLLSRDNRALSLSTQPEQQRDKLVLLAAAAVEHTPAAAIIQCSIAAAGVSYAVQ
jgi:hypothetical protein